MSIKLAILCILLVYLFYSNMIVRILLLLSLAIIIFSIIHGIKEDREKDSIIRFEETIYLFFTLDMIISNYKTLLTNSERYKALYEFNITKIRDNYRKTKISSPIKFIHVYGLYCPSILPPWDKYDGRIIGNLYGSTSASRCRIISKHLLKSMYFMYWVFTQSNIYVIKDVIYYILNMVIDVSYIKTFYHQAEGGIYFLNLSVEEEYKLIDDNKHPYYKLEIRKELDKKKNNDG